MLFVMSTFSVYHFIAWFDQLPPILQYLTVLAQAIWFVQVVIWLGLIQVSTQEWGAVMNRLLVIGVTYEILAHLPDVSQFFDRLVEVLPTF